MHLPDAPARGVQLPAESGPHVSREAGRSSREEDVEGKGMIHPDTELHFVDPEIGYGVFATKPIPRGTVIWTLCELDALSSPEAVRAMPLHDRRSCTVTRSCNPTALS